MAHESKATKKNKHDTHNLFKPLKVGKMILQNRIAMAPLTRLRVLDEKAIPTEIMAEYYEQRSCEAGTLIISESVLISEEAGGYQNVPGIWNQTQIEGWKKVTSAVHKKKSFIYAQLWALGRSADYNYLTKVLGHDYVSASNIPDLSNSSEVDPMAHETRENHAPRALTKQEIKKYIRDFVQAAKNSIEAGFDGVELHAANGYLLDQFIRGCTNVRTDEYGGSIENRNRFVLEIVDAVVDAIGADRVGIRISPYESFGGMTHGPETIPQFADLIAQLEIRGLNKTNNSPQQRLAFVHLVESVLWEKKDNGETVMIRPMEFVRLIWSGILIRTQCFKRDTAIEFSDKDDKLIIGFGRPFISNPDLVRRIRDDLPWAEWDEDTFYTRGAEGYTDYPFYK